MMYVALAIMKILRNHAATHLTRIGLLCCPDSESAFATKLRTAPHQPPHTQVSIGGQESGCVTESPHLAKTFIRKLRIPVRKIQKTIQTQDCVCVPSINREFSVF